MIVTRKVVCIGVGVGALVVQSQPASAGSPAEVRGTWVTTTGLTSPNSTIVNPAATATNFRRLRDIGLNSVYVDVWRNGYTYYQSPTLQQTIGVGMFPGLGSRDVLRETLIQSHRNGMAQVAWFQYGFAAKFGTPGTSNQELAKVMKDRGWLLTDAAGSYTNASNSFSWMNPAVPGVRQFMIGVVTDAVKKYDLDGVQFDDRLAWPVQFGYDTATRDAYRSETGREVPANFNDAHFKQWRAQKVTSFAQEMIAAVKAIRPNAIVSSAPSVYPFSYDSYCVDWPTWKSLGMFDEFVPQVYRNSAQSFADSWDGVGSITNGGQVQFMTGRREDFRAGISINRGDGTPNAWTDVAQSIDVVRGTSGVGGHVLWYSEGILNTYATQAAAYYDVPTNGQAPRGDLPLDWRPAPIDATSTGTGAWQAPVPEKNRYRVIVRNGTVWTETLSTVFPPGTLNISATADEVELLVDRRGFINGDANLDDVVNLTDFNILAANFGMSVNGWAFADFTLDGIVNLADFNLLAGNFGQTSGGVAPAPEDWAALASVLPEPSIFSLLVLPLTALTRRRR